MLQNRWVVGVHEQQEQHHDEIVLRRLEELELQVTKQKNEIQTIKPTVAMIGMDKDGNALETHPPQNDDAQDDDEMDQEHDESVSEATERALGVSGELDDSETS